jgi:hypothetical protein
MGCLFPPRCTSSREGGEQDSFGDALQTEALRFRWYLSLPYTFGNQQQSSFGIYSV